MNGEIQGFSLCRAGPKLTHIFFANDCLIFCRSTLDECNKIQELLACYEAASGQVINKEKTTLCFSRNTDEATQEAIKVALDVPAIDIMRSIWVYLCWLEGIGRRVSLKSKKEFGVRCKGGRKSCFLKPVERL